TNIDDIVAALSLEHGGEEFAELRWWTSSLLHEVQNYRRDLNLLTPWVAISSTNLSLSYKGAEPALQWRSLSARLDGVPALAHISEICDAALVQLAALRAQIEPGANSNDKSAGAEQDLEVNPETALAELAVLTGAIEQAAETAKTCSSRLAQIAQTCQRILDEMDFEFLLDPERKVFSIGYNVTEGHLDNSYYDLLATEARLASFVAVAKGDVPQEHWFRMG